MYTDSENSTERNLESGREVGKWSSTDTHKSEALHPVDSSASLFSEVSGLIPQYQVDWACRQLGTAMYSSLHSCLLHYYPWRGERLVPCRFDLGAHSKQVCGNFLNWVPKTLDIEAYKKLRPSNTRAGAYYHHRHANRWWRHDLRGAVCIYIWALRKIFRRGPVSPFQPLCPEVAWEAYTCKGGY